MGPGTGPFIHAVSRDAAMFSGIILYGFGYGISLTVLYGFLIQEKGFTPARGFTGFHVLAVLFFLQVLLQWVLGYRSGKTCRGS
ncbi:MAG: hypothetical protein U5K27_03875 [Desulfotignum sp.]|nr:hypothetical protein [Desulfotignum sp.]